MTVRVVDLLEVVEVEHDQRQLASVATGACDFAIERLCEVALVENLRQPIDGGQAIDLLVIGALDVPAGKELENRASDLDEVAIDQRTFLDQLVVDVGAVGRPEIANPNRPAGIGDLRVRARDRLLVDLDVALVGTAEGNGWALEAVLAPQVVAIDHHQTSLFGWLLAGNPIDARDDGLGPDVVHIGRHVVASGRCA